MNKSREDTQLLLENIESVALNIFREKGYRATRLQDVADAMGITRGPLYYHFRSKRALYTHCINVIFNQIYDSTVKIFNNTSPLITCVKRDILFFLSINWEMKFLYDIERIPELSDELDRSNRFNSEIFEYKKIIINERKQRGEIRSDADTAEIVSYIFSIYYAISSVQHYLNIGKNEVDSLLNNHLEAFRAIYLTNTVD